MHFLCKKDYSFLLQFLGCSFLLITICIWQVSGCNVFSITVYFLGIFCLYISSLFAIYMINTNGQFCNNAVLLVLIEILAFIYICINAKSILPVIGSFKLCLITSSLLMLAMAQGISVWFCAGKRKSSPKCRTEFVFVFVIAVIWGFLLNIECFNTWPRWDPYHYYLSFESVTASNIFIPGSDGLVVCAHNCMAYCLWGLLFRLIPGISNLNAMYLSNMALVLVDTVLLYLIFKKLLKKKVILSNMLCALVIASSPWILGHVANLNLENIMIMGILLLLYAVFSSNAMLGVIGVFIICFSKETGAVVAAAIIFMQLIYDLINYIKKRKNINYIYYVYYILNFILGCLWLAIFLKGNWGNKNLKTDRTMQDGNPYNTFNFSLMHIRDVLIDTFIINFNWIFFSIIVFTTGYIIAQIYIKKKKIHIFLTKKFYVILAMALAVYVGESCAFLTYRNFRYYIISSVLLEILALCSLQFFCCEKKLPLRWQYTILGLLCGIMFVQSYRFIDPVSMAIYPKVNTGEATMIPLAPHTSVDKNWGMQETVYSNRQVMYFDKTLDKAYAAIYEKSNLKSTKILCSNEYSTRIINGKVAIGSLYNIWGFGYAYANPPMYGRWNSSGKYRYLTYEQPIDSIDPGYVLGDTDLEAYMNEYEHVYYLKMPWGDTVLEKLQKKYPSISKMQTVKYRGWVLEIYQVK